MKKPRSAVTSSPAQEDMSSSTAASARPQASFTISSGQSEESLQQLLEEGLEDTQHFPMGYRRHTRSKDGWVDLACGPSISISILYLSRAHHPNNALPNSLRIDVDSPKVLLRVFGFLARDLLALKVSPAQCHASHVHPLASLPACRRTTPESTSTSPPSAPACLQNTTRQLTPDAR